MSSDPQFARFASPNERRTISREDLGIYNAVLVGGVYEYPAGSPLNSPKFYFSPLAHCIEQHPFLCVIVRDAGIEKSSYHRVSSIDLEKHIYIVGNVSEDESDQDAIEAILALTMDEPFPIGIPPWKLVVLPLNARQSFVAFAYSHTIGDGNSGIAFQRTFLEGSEKTPRPSSPKTSLIQTPQCQLAEPFDTPERLPISWSYLFTPLASLLLPQMMARMLGLQARVAHPGLGTWTGARMCESPEIGTHSRVKLFEIEADILQNAVQIARANGSTLTGLIHQIITRALSQVIRDPAISNFMSTTPTNLRRLVGVSNNEMGNFVSTSYLTHTRLDADGLKSGINWEEACQASRKIAEAASSLQDQPLGLLRYVSNIRKWMLGRFGDQREGSWEVSNVGVFDATRQKETGHEPETQVKLMKIIFSQPGQVLGAPFAFSFATVKEGSMTITISWQKHALGIPLENEDEFVDEIRTLMFEDFRNLA